jgi:hypothetical protein
LPGWRAEADRVELGETLTCAVDPPGLVLLDRVSDLPSAVTTHIAVIHFPGASRANATGQERFEHRVAGVCVL